MINSIRNGAHRRFFILLAPVVGCLLLLAQQAQGQDGNLRTQKKVPSHTLVEPIVRVSHKEKVAQPPKLAARVAPLNKPIIPFDLTQRPGEHPLQPALRMANQCLNSIETNIIDYSAILLKQERIDGELGEEQAAFIKIRHKPFGVYMFFLKPHKGREVLYNAAPGGGKGVMVAMDCGWKRSFGKMEFDPEGRMAMRGQKYPITKLGIYELTKELVEVATNDINYGECEVKSSQRIMKIGADSRQVTKLEIVHPQPRKEFRFHKAELFIDNELRIPIRYASYLWPKSPGQSPPLEEVYTYVNLKINQGFTDLDFDKDNPAIFKN